MELTHAFPVTMTLTITKRKAAHEWCTQQFGPQGETWSYGILPGTYEYQTYDYVWKFSQEAQALQFALAWC